MTTYDIALFIHMIGVIAMFSGFAIYQRGGIRLRAATDMDQVRNWLGLLESTNRMFSSGSLLLLISGVYMMASRWRAPLPWIVVAIVGLFTIAIVGATVSGRQLRRIRAAVSDARESISGDLALRIADPLLWSVLAALNGLAIGIVFVMSTKPGWAVSIAVVVAAAIIGAAVGARTARSGVRADLGSAVTAS